MVSKWLMGAGMVVVLLATPGMPHAGEPGQGASLSSARLAQEATCTCRFAGVDYGLGETVCIRGKQAICDRVLNNTSWTFSEMPCLYLSRQIPPRADDRMAGLAGW